VANQSFVSEDLSDSKSNLLGGLQQPNQIDSYAVFRFLHSPEHIFADAFLLFEKLMELGIKDMFYKGNSLKGYTNTLFDEDSDPLVSQKMGEKELARKKRKRDLLVREEDAERTALRKRCFKISNHLMRQIDEELHKHLLKVEFIPELSLLKWLRVLFSREFSL